MHFNNLVENILNEAFPLGWAKAYTKRNNPLYQQPETLLVKKIQQLFKNKHRLVYYIPPNEDGNASKEQRNNPTRDAIDAFLYKHGYNTFYYEGYATKIADRHNAKINIGKLLQRLEQDETTMATNIHGKQHVVRGSPLLHAYKNDKLRIEDINIGYYIVVSRHPYDIMGAWSGDRNYSSCQTGHSPKIARGTGNWRQDVANHNAEMDTLKHPQFAYKDSKAPNWHHVPGGDTLVAYLVPENYDKSKDILRNPLARVILSIESAGNRVWIDHPERELENMDVEGIDIEDIDINPINFTEFYGETNEQFIKFINDYCHKSYDDWDAIVHMPTVDIK